MRVRGRGEWGARFGRGGAPEPGTAGAVVVHHFWRPHIDADATPEDEASAMRGVETFHVEERGWAGLGYNFVVFQSGRVYEGRGWGQSGAHTRGMNRRSHGVAFAVDGDEHALTPAAVYACRYLLDQGVRSGDLDPDFEIYGHRDFADKSCPGDLVYPVLRTLRPADAGEEET